MPLDFPSNPTNGQTYENFVYDTSITAWRNQGSPNSLSSRVSTLEAGVPLGSWTSYTPTFSNFTAGNASISAKYSRVGKTVFVQFHMIVGSTTSFSGTPVVTLPSNMRQGAYNAAIGSITNSSGIFPFVVNISGGYYAELYGMLTNGQWGLYGGFVGSISTATGACIGFTLTYEEL